jgi:hypothetical protein
LYSLVFMNMHQPMTCDILNFGNYHLGGIVGIKGHMESTTTTTSKYNKPRIFLPPFYILGSWFTLFPLSLHILNKMRCVQCLHILRTHAFIGMLVNLKHYIIDLLLVNMHTRFTTFTFNRTTNIVSIKAHC